MKIKLTSEQTKINLDELLGDDISATNISATKEDMFSATKLSATNISDTKVKKISATKYMNQYKKEKYDTIRFDVKKGTKSFLLNEASKRGISLTQMIKDALKLYLSTN